MNDIVTLIVNNNNIMFIYFNRQCVATFNLINFNFKNNIYACLNIYGFVTEIQTCAFLQFANQFYDPFFRVIHTE